jgi:deazaflavin-dependent oxidoreductase (nitroreductase family)
MTDLNQQIIEEFRANGGHVETMGFGDSLIILHSTGARSGKERVNPVLAIPTDDGGWLIAASKAGAPDNPGWYANLMAHPTMRIEVGTSTVDVTATEITGDDYPAAWAKFTAQSDAFKEYEKKAGGRHIPVILLSPR